MKTLNDLHFSDSEFLTKKDRLCILGFINNTPCLFDSNSGYGVSKVELLAHGRTHLRIHVIGAGMITIEKCVIRGNSYGWKAGVNFLVLPE